MLFIIIGFNTRPLAEYCHDLGIKPVVIDFFGDLDIISHVSEGYYYVDDYYLVNGEPVSFQEWCLDVLKGIKAARMENDRDGSSKPFLIIGSGFDDHFSYWDKFIEYGHLLGNNSKTMKMARDLAQVKSLVIKHDLNINFPETRIYTINKNVDVRAVLKDILLYCEVPFIIKRKGKAGGAGITLIKNNRELSAFLMIIREELKDFNAGEELEIMVQEFIKGGDVVNASVLACDDRILAITEQFIGINELNAPGPFIYCGNSVPATRIPWHSHKILKKFVKLLHDEMGLRGVYGIDFLHVKNSLYFMELNPRIPGSLEPASLAFGKNFLHEHLKSFLAPLELEMLGIFNYERHDNDGFLEFKKPEEHAIKCILFSSMDFVMPTLDNLMISGTIKDITRPGVRIARGEPILTYIYKGDISSVHLNKVWALMEIKKIYEYLEEQSEHVESE
ncbi:MAG: ATP-grasp domain-containing protein [Promethearchaeota archaeon]